MKRLWGFLLLLFVAGVSARSAVIQLGAVERVGGGVRMEWSDGGHKAFVVQSRDTFKGGLWVLADAPHPWPITTNRWTSTPATGTSSRFYRVLAVEPAERGKLISSSQIATHSAFELAFLFNFGGIPIQPQHAVTVYKVVYETLDPWGGKTQASGAVVIPQVAGRRWALASYQHGTLASRSEAPTDNPIGERALGLAFATTGYVGVIPDYLGLGESPLVQPYHHARSEGTAGVDLLRAARALCASLGVELNGQLFLAGYSHGGHATMAMMRELETHHADEFTVTATAAMAGAYDLSGVTTDDFLSGRPKPSPYYSLLLLASFQSVYGIAPSLADLLASPYDKTLPPLATGGASGSTIDRSMPSDPSLTLKPEVLAAFRSDPNHPLRVALRDNDLTRWTPRGPLRMYHCRGDRDVLVGNSLVALNAFRAAGSTQVEYFDVDPTADHGGCVEPSLLAAKAWFDQLRQ